MIDYNKFIGKIGTDKFAHFGIGGLIAACMYIAAVIGFGILGFIWHTLIMAIAALIVLVISIWKEKHDSVYCKADIIAAELGVGVVYLSVLFAFLLSWIF